MENKVVPATVRHSMPATVQHSTDSAAGRRGGAGLRTLHSLRLLGLQLQKTYFKTVERTTQPAPRRRLSWYLLRLSGLPSTSKNIFSKPHARGRL